MGRKSTKLAGLYQDGTGIWHIDKRIGGIRFFKSTGERDEKKAVERAITLIEERRQEIIHGVRPRRTFRAAATKYLEENRDKKSIARDAQALKLVDPYIGSLALEQVHAGTVQGFIQARRRSGTAQGTINRDLAVVRRILNLSARVWRHANGKTWLETAPLIELPKDRNARKPYPITWAEQRLLLKELPEHLVNMALFALHTGCREGEICGLRWDWEAQVPELGIRVFLLPGEATKNGRERVVVLNRVARSVVEAARGAHPVQVFTYEGHPLTRMLNTAWKGARQRAADRYAEEIGGEAPWGFRHLRVHDLRHTLGRRARSVGVPLEDREDILGHASGRMTTHYSAAEVGRLLEALERVADSGDLREIPEATVLRVIK